MKATITSQHHHLHGQQFDIDELSSNNLEVILQLPDGVRLPVPSNLTDYMKVSDSESTSIVHLLDIIDLCEIVKIVAQIKEEPVK